MEGSAIKLLGAGIAMFGALGAGVGLGMIFSSWLSALARNPSAEDKFNKVGYIGFAAAELVLLFSVAIAILLMFAV